MNRLLTWILLASLAGLIWFSHRLAGVRIYHADECENISMARILATGQAKIFHADPGLFHLGLLSWLTKGAPQSVDMFVAARFVMLELLWLNILLIAIATGERLLTRRGLIALLGAATLAPLWACGFEIRPDNLLLSGLLLMWCVVRVRPSGLQPYLFAGALTVALQFVSFKAALFTLPISCAILAFPPKAQTASRGKLVAAWLGGTLGMFVILRLVYGAVGLWDVYVTNLREVVATARPAVGVALPAIAARFLVQTPLLSACLMAALISVAVSLRRLGRAGWSWNSNLPEALLVLLGLVVLVLNPAPSMSSLILLAPFAYILAFRYAAGMFPDVWSRFSFRPIVVLLPIFACFIPFALAVRHDLGWTNYHQEARIRLAEALTDPVKDPVFDGVGMVPVRPRIDFRWSLPDSSRPGSAGEPGVAMQNLLAAHPAAVFLPNYRTDALPEKFQALIRERYVSLSDDFQVLGKVLRPGGGAFEIVHPGRYRISTLETSDLAGTYPEGLAGLMEPLKEGIVNGTIDGLTISNRPVFLSIGTHRIETIPECQPAVVWVGPRRDRLGRLGESDHNYLFVRSY